MTVNEILGKDIILNRYDMLFHVETSEEKDKELEKLNAFIGMVFPDISAGRRPDIEALAKRQG